MKVRYPVMDFSNLRPHWSATPEFAQFCNAFSTVPAHIEPFLVKVMKKVQQTLDPKHEQLHRNVEIFNQQEMQHCKQHIAFNKQLVSLGYEGMPAVEAPYKNDYARFYAEKSLRFNVAYSEGFEAMGSAAAQIFFEDLVDYFDGADKDAMNLWLWHLAEEFEHREVCADVYRALYGNGPYAYFYRISLFLYATCHIGSHTFRVFHHLLAKDRESMGKDEIKASKKREKLLKRRYIKAGLKRLACVFSPFYDPGKKVQPAGMAEILDAYPDTRPS